MTKIIMIKRKVKEEGEINKWWKDNYMQQREKKWNKENEKIIKEKKCFEDKLL